MSISIGNPVSGTNVVNTVKCDSKVQHSKNGAFDENLFESSANTVIQEIHDKFGLNVGESGHRIECYIPRDVLYRMSQNDNLKQDIYTVLEDYTCTEFKIQLDTLNPPVKKCKLIFDKDANVVANLEPDIKKLEEEYEQLKGRRKSLSLFGPISKRIYELHLEIPEDSISDIQIQSTVATSVIQTSPTK